MAKRSRLKKMVNWTIQGPLVVRLIAHFLAYNAATLFLLLIIHGINESVAAIADQPINTEPMTLWQKAAPLVICMFLLMPFMIWDLVKLSNRIAGPLFRFESILKDFAKSGTLRPAKIRQGDLLTDYQSRFNEFVESLHALYPELKPVENPFEKLATTVSVDAPVAKNTAV